MEQITQYKKKNENTISRLGPKQFSRVILIYAICVLNIDKWVKDEFTQKNAWNRQSESGNCRIGLVNSHKQLQASGSLSFSFHGAFSVSAIFLKAPLGQKKYLALPSIK